MRMKVRLISMLVKNRFFPEVELALGSAANGSREPLTPSGLANTIKGG
jgi:hypothetical protein